MYKYKYEKSQEHKNGIYRKYCWASLTYPTIDWASGPDEHLCGRLL